jgi:hypothetical protein
VDRSTYFQALYGSATAAAQYLATQSAPVWRTGNMLVQVGASLWLLPPWETAAN